MRKNLIRNFLKFVICIRNHLTYSFLFNMRLKLHDRGFSKYSVRFTAMVMIDTLAKTVSFNERCQVPTKSMTLQAVNHRIDGGV